MSKEIEIFDEGLPDSLRDLIMEANKKKAEQRHLESHPEDAYSSELDQTAEQQKAEHAEKCSVDLRDRLSRLNAPRDYSVGDIVRWKKGLVNKSWPEVGSVFIVSEILDNPMTSRMDGREESPHAGERLDVRILALSGEDVAMEMYLDGRRIERV